MLSSRHLPGGRPRCAKGALRPQAAACAASVVESPTVHASNGNSASSEEPASAAAGPPIGSGPTFQEAVLRLSQYWAERADCIIYMPTNTEVEGGPCQLHGFGLASAHRPESLACENAHAFQNSSRTLHAWTGVPSKPAIDGSMMTR